MEQHAKIFVHTLELLCICTICDSTNINTIIQFFPNCSYHVSGNGFNSVSDSYLQFRDTHAPCLLKLCIPPWDGIAKEWLFPEFVSELPLETVPWRSFCINISIYTYSRTANLNVWTFSSHRMVTMFAWKVSIFWTLQNFLMILSLCLNAYSIPNLQQR